MSSLWEYIEEPETRYYAVGFPSSPQSAIFRITRHEADYLALTEDLGVHMTLDEYDRISPKRIKTIIDVQQHRLEEKARRAKAEEERRAREIARNKIIRK